MLKNKSVLEAPGHTRVYMKGEYRYKGKQFNKIKNAILESEGRNK